MCWNKDVSLNTFMFSMVTLLFIYYNNKYTKYKIKEFTTIWVYLLFVSFISMQIVEYFLWNYMGNNKLNKLFTYLAIFVILLQPFCSIMLLKDDNTKKNMMLCYFLFILVLVYFYIVTKKNIKTSIADNGHLKWDWLPLSSEIIFCIVWSLWFFFLFYPLYKTNIKSMLICFSILCVSIYTYLKHHTYHSMWCWMTNFIMFIFLIQILVILPYKEKGTLC